MDPIDNPMTQLARMYALVEDDLRRAARNNTPISMGELAANEEIRRLQKGPWQLKNIVNSLRSFGHLKPFGVGAGMKYTWDLDSPPFVFAARKRERMRTDPSDPTTLVERAPTTAAPTRVHQNANKEVEFVFNGVEFVVGINPATGNLRLKIEQT